MKRINSFPFYELGAAITPLQEYTPTIKTTRALWPMVRAQFALKAFLDEKFIPLNFSMQTAKELFVQLHDVIPVEGPVPSTTPEQELGFSGYLIAEKAKTFEHELAAELRQLDTYFVPDKGIFSTSKLMQRADEMFEPSIRTHLSERVKLDVREAGKCIACELGTAAGFHIARAVEAVLLVYLEHLCPDEVAKLTSGQRNLGSYIKLARDNKGEEKLCGCLDQFRDLHRNPLMHPEDILTTDEAISLLGIAQSSIIAMVLEITGKNNQPLLPLEVEDGSKPG